MEPKRCVVIIGSGPAGLTAAIYTGRACRDTLVIAGVEAGGQLMTTQDVENYPGFPEGVQGPDLMANMRRQAERFGAEFVDDNVTEVDFSGQPLRVKTGDTWHDAAAVIIATGASPRWLGLENEARLRGRGVSSCATCDGAFFRNLPVVVVGGGDAGVEEATLLSQIASHVTLIHRRDKLRAQPILQQRLFAQGERVDVAFDSEVVDILGDRSVEGVLVENKKTGQRKTIECRGVFISIGHVPNTTFLGDQLGLDERGYVAKQGETRTAVPGVFVAGDVYDYQYRQAVTAAGSGCKAALDAIRFVEDLRCDACKRKCNFGE